ncbi:MAG: hypothetical protein M1322_01555 [Candidatus Parvarchaeota archaeon]|nr:hypothetical protein [Candidatus Parvarchaeota archaeon]MCL5106788.1 hypothetical protein [Candidatus Parvarchaeota archaeon]
MESLDEKREVRGEASELLKLLLESRKEGLAYMHAIVDGPDFNYKSLERKDLNSRKYSLENSLSGIAETLKQYIWECDKLSFGNKLQNELRQYLVKPYLKEGLQDLLDDVLYDVTQIYKIEMDNSHDLFLNVNHSKGGYKENNKNENIKKILKEINEIEDSTEFVCNLEDSIDFARGLKIITYKKL